MSSAGSSARCMARALRRCPRRLVSTLYLPIARAADMRPSALSDWGRYRAFQHTSASKSPRSSCPPLQSPRRPRHIYTNDTLRSGRISALKRLAALLSATATQPVLAADSHSSSVSRVKPTSDLADASRISSAV